MEVSAIAKKELIKSKLNIHIKTVGSLHTVQAYIKPYRLSSVVGEVLCKKGLIHNFQVYTIYRNHGVGSILLRAAINQVDNDKFQWKLFAKTERNGMPQEALEKFYESFGFKATGLINKAGKEMVLERATTTTTAR